MKFFTILLLFLFNSTFQNTMNFISNNSYKSSKIPSGSGLVFIQNSYFIIGDDASQIFQLNQNLQIINQLDLNLKIPKNEIKNNRIIKSKKPDLEAAEKISDHEFVIFGSGSKSPQRDIFIRVLLKDNKVNSIQKYQITDFYNHLKNLPIFSNSELNIEAAAFKNDILYLFNRNKNSIIYFNYPSFLDYISNNNQIPTIYTQSITLPIINNVQAGFSGAIAFQNQNAILFTASLENTNNAIDDGEILGSILGIIDLKDSKPLQNIKYCTIPNTNENLKVESVIIKNQISTNSYNLLLISDDDSGNSIFTNGTLNL